MRTITEVTGATRLWYDAGEIEQITAQALREAKLWPDDRGSAIEIEQLLEVHMSVAIDYGAPLDAAVLGYTSFESPIRVVINRTLTQAAQRPGAGRAAVGRWRATLAHEAAHILLHARLFDVETGTGDGLPAACLRTEVGTTKASDWREVQANMGMAALLLPRPAVGTALRGMLLREGAIPPVSCATPVAYRMIGEVTRLFAVSRQLARIRLIEMGMLASDSIDVADIAQEEGSSATSRHRCVPGGGGTGGSPRSVDVLGP